VRTRAGDKKGGDKGNRDEWRKKAKEAREKVQAKIREALTDEQKKKFDDFLKKQEERRSGWRARQGPGRRQGRRQAVGQAGRQAHRQARLAPSAGGAPPPPLDPPQPSAGGLPPVAPRTGPQNARRESPPRGALARVVFGARRSRW